MHYLWPGIGWDASRQPAKSVLRLRPTFAIFIPVEFNKPHMKRFLLAACMLLAAVGFSSCENDDDDLYDTLTGRVWAGDLGFYQDGYALDSYVYFGADGFGSDELRYADNGRLLDTLNIQWDAYDDTVYIDYGRVDLPRELRRVHIRRGMLTTDLYIGGRYYDRITLYMQ